MIQGLIQFLKLLVIAAIITAVLSFSTIGFITMFVRFDENTENIIRYGIVVLTFSVVLGFSIIHKYKKR